MIKLKLLFHYYKSTQRFNLPFSLLIGVLSLAISRNKAAGLISGFSLCLVTGGFALALYFYEQRYSNQYFFYHNQGLSRMQLAAGAMSANLLLVFLFFLLRAFLLHG